MTRGNNGVQRHSGCCVCQCRIVVYLSNHFTRTWNTMMEISKVYSECMCAVMGSSLLKCARSWIPSSWGADGSWSYLWPQTSLQQSQDCHITNPSLSIRTKVGFRRVTSHSFFHFMQWLARCVEVRKWARFELLSQALFYILHRATSITFRVCNQMFHQECLRGETIRKGFSFTFERGLLEQIQTCLPFRCERGQTTRRTN